jgi:23S rRNA pseudouridine2605 synthase
VFDGAAAVGFELDDGCRLKAACKRQHRQSNERASNPGHVKTMTQNGGGRRRKLARPAASTGVPLSRALSKLGILSRAQAVEAIRAGRVSVDGVVVRNAALLVAPERARVLVDGVERRRAAWRTIVFHKPRGVVTTRRDPEGRRTIYDVLGEDGEGLVAVGRLDLATSGLLLLTSDTRLADWITDPVHQVPRVYAVTVRGRIAVAQLARLPGVTLRKASAREIAPDGRAARRPKPAGAARCSTRSATKSPGSSVSSWAVSSLRISRQGNSGTFCAQRY